MFSVYRINSSVVVGFYLITDHLALRKLGRLFLILTVCLCWSIGSVAEVGCRGDWRDAGNQNCRDFLSPDVLEESYVQCLGLGGTSDECERLRDHGDVSPPRRHEARSVRAEEERRRGARARQEEAARLPLPPVPPPVTEEGQQEVARVSGECESLRQACIQANESAEQECDADSSGSSSGRMGRSGVSQVAAQVDRMSNASGAAGVEICSAMSNVSAVANSAVAGLSWMCGSHQSTCVDKCGELLRRVDSNQCSSVPNVALAWNDREELRGVASQKRQECNRMSARASERGEALNRTAQSLLGQSQRCISQIYPGGLPEFCRLNPDSPACMSYANNDCSNPRAATSNPTCIAAMCGINPSLPQCTSTNLARAKASSGGIDGLTGLGGAERLNSTSSGGGTDGLNFGSSNDSFASMSPSNSNPAEKVGGKKNILTPQEGGGLGPAPSSGRPMAKVDEDKARIFKGGRGGAATGTGWPTPAAVPRSSGLAESNFFANPALNQGIDLRQFLPGGKHDASRGLATVIGPDGLSGAHSNNFTKIKNRYFHQHSINSFIVGQ